MNISGIIAEYNPFHNGHLYHIKKTKELTNCDALIVIMSGNFVQRGIPALVDKWSRAKIALNNGADLVIELPALYSCSSAEFFAFGAVSLLNNIGVVNHLSFGSECGDSNLLYHIAKILVEEPEDFKTNLKCELDNGSPYPTARSKALLNFINDSNYNLLNDNTKDSIKDLIRSSNNILGIEYCKSLIKLNSTIKPCSIKREGGSYNSTDLDDNFSSASSIRKFLKQHIYNLPDIKMHVPTNVYNLICDLDRSDYKFSFEDSMVPYLKYKCILDKNSLENLPDVSEGIHNRIFRSIENSTTYEEIISSVKTKRYTYTRISRILCQLFLGFDKVDTFNLRKKTCPYARVLGVNPTGLKILKEMKKSSSIPVYTKIPKEINDLLKLDLQCTSLYSLINNSISEKEDYLRKFTIE